MNPYLVRWRGFWFDHLLLRVLTILACLWLWYHLKPTPMITLTTPTRTVMKVCNGLPDIAGMKAVEP